MEDDCFLLDVSAEAELVDLFFLPEFFLSLFLFSWGHFESMSQVLEGDCNIAFVSALTAFLMASSQESRSRPRASNWAWIEGLRPSRKYWIMISSFEVVARSNSWKTASRYSRCAAQSKTSSSWCWESFLIFPH